MNTFAHSWTCVGIEKDDAEIHLKAESSTGEHSTSLSELTMVEDYLPIDNDRTTIKCLTFEKLIGVIEDDDSDEPDYKSSYSVEIVELSDVEDTPLVTNRETRHSLNVREMLSLQQQCVVLVL
ncbi:hypothetical protein GEMRC1_001165 [Eukaryota sp. GEM-RC1]